MDAGSTHSRHPHIHVQRSRRFLTGKLLGLHFAATRLARSVASQHWLRQSRLRFAATRLARSPTGWAPQGAFTAFVGARPRSSLGQALRAKLFRQFVRRQAGSHRSTGSHRRATRLLQSGRAHCSHPVGDLPGPSRLHRYLRIHRNEMTTAAGEHKYVPDCMCVRDAPAAVEHGADRVCQAACK